MSDLYVLDDNGNAVKTDDIRAWDKATSSRQSVIGRTIVGTVTVSTVFLGMDHGWGEGPPVLWETMIFGGKHDEFQERYTSRSDAIAGHLRAVKRVLKERKGKAT